MAHPSICQFAGHGGPGDTRHERGFVSPDGSFVEKNWCLDLSRDIDAALIPWGIKSSLGRTDDTMIPHQERAMIAVNFGANFVVEHHVNAHADTEIDGIMCFARGFDNVAIEVGEAISRAAPKGLLRRKSRIHIATEHDWTKDAYACVRHYGSTPALLIEWGFATSTRDLAILTSEASRPALVAAFMAGAGRLYEVL